MILAPAMEIVLFNEMDVLATSEPIKYRDYHYQIKEIIGEYAYGYLYDTVDNGLVRNTKDDQDGYTAQKLGSIINPQIDKWYVNLRGIDTPPPGYSWWRWTICAPSEDSDALVKVSFDNNSVFIARDFELEAHTHDIITPTNPGS